MDGQERTFSTLWSLHHGMNTVQTITFSSNYINAGEISDNDESTFFENSEQYYSPRSRSRQDTPETHSRGPSGTYDFIRKL